MACRGDFNIIKNWVAAESRILDLACGNGELLDDLSKEKNVRGYGLEINPQNIEACIRRGINVIEQDLDRGLGNFKDGSFDTVIMTQALQVMHFPHLVLDEMLRVGRECIVTFPEFWALALQTLSIHERTYASIEIYALHLVRHT